MSLLPRCFFLGALSLSLGCGGAQPAATGPEGQQPGTADVPGANDSAALIAGDLTPVAAPDTLVAVGRLKNPRHVVQVVSNWAKYPIDVEKMIDREERGLSQIVKLDAPIEFALALDPSAPQEPVPFVVFSVGLNSLEDAVAFARDRGDSVDEIRSGVYAIRDCIVASAVGPAPARLVCGDSNRDLDALSDYATRGLPNEALGSGDFYLDVRAEPFRKLYGNQLRRGRTVLVPMALNELQMGEPRFDRALADAIHALADEVLALVDDIDRVTLEGGLDTSKQVATSTLNVKFRSKRSWVASTSATFAKRATVAPDIFWSLPKDVGMASYSVGADPKHYAGILSTGIELLDGAMSNKQVPPRVRTQLLELVKKLFVSDAVSAYASGAAPASGASFEKMSTAARDREMVRSGIGWHVIGVQEPPKRWKNLLDQMSKTYQSRDLRRYMGTLGAPTKDFPKLRKRGAGLGAGSTQWELVIPGKAFEPGWTPPGEKKVRGKALSMFLILMPDGDRTWIGFSADQKLLKKKMAAVKKAAPAAQKLSGRAGLGGLKTTKAIGGGFFTLDSFTNGASPTMMALRDELGVDASKALAQLPNRGQTPMLHFTRVQDGAGPTISVSRTVRGPSMSTTPGKVVVDGVTRVAGEKVFVLKFLQGRDPDWVGRPFFARYDAEASWLSDLEPAFGEEEFFFERSDELGSTRLRAAEGRGRR